MTPPRVLIVEDDASIGLVVSAALQAENIEIFLCDSVVARDTAFAREFFRNHSGKKTCQQHAMCYSSTEKTGLCRRHVQMNRIEISCHLRKGMNIILRYQPNHTRTITRTDVHRSNNQNCRY